MQDFPQPKIRGDVVGVELQSMLEVFCSLLGLTRVSLQSREMKARTKMLLVDEKALLEHLD